MLIVARRMCTPSPSVGPRVHWGVGVRTWGRGRSFLGRYCTALTVSAFLAEVQVYWSPAVVCLHRVRAPFPGHLPKATHRSALLPRT